MINEFGISHAAGQFSLSVFMFGFAAGQLLSGPLSDIYGRRPLLLWGIALCMVASVVCATPATIELLLIGRFLQGLGASVGSIVARVIVGDLYHREEAAKVLAWIMGLMALVPALAPIIGSELLHWFSWRSHYFFLVILCLVLLIIVMARLPETCHTKTKSLSARVMLQRFFVCIRTPAFLGYLGTASCVFGAMFACISSAPFIFIEILNISPENFGHTYLYVAFGYMAGAFLSAKVVVHLGIKRTLGIGVALLMIAALLWLIQALLEIHNIGIVLLSSFLVFMAGGLSIANSQAGAFHLFPESLGGTASLLGFIKILFGSICGVIVGQLYDGTLLPTALVVMGAAILASGFYITRLKEMNS